MRGSEANVKHVEVFRTVRVGISILRETSIHLPPLDASTRSSPSRTVNCEEPV